jgi:hypothetical protein
MELIEINFNWYEFRAKTTPEPITVFGSYNEDERVVVFVCEEMEEAA